MAIQFTDFSKAPLLDSPAASIFEDVLKGYKMSQAPKKMQQESDSRALANKLKDLDVQHKPKEYALNDAGKALANALRQKALDTYDERWELDKQVKQANIKKALQEKVGGSAKANGELANFMVANPNATPEEIKGAYEEIHGKNMDHKDAMINRSRDITAGNQFDKLPVNDKKQSVALMKGMGVDPVEAVAYLRQSGNSPSKYAENIGVDITTVIPDYAAGEQNIKEAQQAEAYMREMETLEDHINEGLGEYQNKIMGYSFNQIADSADGKNDDKVAKALAARALQPELIALRLKIMKANVGIEALRELEEKSLGSLKIIDSLVDKKIFNKAQEYMSKWINEAGTRRNKALIGNSMLKSMNQRSAESESNMGNDPLGLF